MYKETVKIIEAGKHKLEVTQVGKKSVVRVQPSGLAIGFPQNQEGLSKIIRMCQDGSFDNYIAEFCK